MNIKEQLITAWENVKEGNAEAAQAAETVVLAVKSLPRTADGLFELGSVAENSYQAASLVYPVYTAYETLCNKKEGYPDILAQMRVLNGRLQEEFTLENAAAALDMMIHTIQAMSPEIYESYRELSDIFKENVKKVIGKYYREDETAQNRSEEADKLFRSAVGEACRQHILLAEKYQAFC